MRCCDLRGDDAPGYRKRIRAHFRHRIGLVASAWPGDRSDLRTNDPPPSNAPCPQYAADLDRQEIPDLPSPPPIARNNSAPWSEPHTDISEFRRCRMIGGSAGAPVRRQRFGFARQAAPARHSSIFARRRDPRRTSLPKPHFRAALEDGGLPSPFPRSIGKDGDNADGRFSAGSKCAYLHGFTQSMRRRKIDHELQGNKRSAECRSSRTNAEPCSATPRCPNPRPR